MKQQKGVCYKCGKENVHIKMYDYTICESCRKRLGLFTDDTIQRYLSSTPKFEQEMDRRLKVVEKDYISKKIKLLYIKDRIRALH